MLGENLLKISKEDLGSSLVLYENKNYAQALFYFHQAVEKTTKYLALSCGITESEFKRKYGHNGIKLFKGIVIAIQNQNDLIPDITFISLLNHLEMVEAKTKSLSDQDVVYSLLKEINITHATPYPISTKDLSKPLQLMIDYLKEIGVTHELIVGPMSELHYEIIEQELYANTLKTIATINFNSKIIPILFFLIVFTNRYKVDDFRYPSSDIDNPSDYFTIDNMYVVELQKLFPILQNTIDSIERMININNS